ncbi:cytochrome P450 [Crystallibacter degradans]|uniref:cytochrome P450 n=1 Tax=Crystallibacter degradans TaxID=2726743 RepID=UPI00147420AD|nr:cytochrome P450 [Arthrobacter sp. SF27]NMR31639.1 cytochrome P450 [Arthrobacter sp. SF27]
MALDLSTATAPVFTEDPYSDDNLRDPYPLFARMRDAGPAVWLERYGVPAFTRFDVCKEILEDYSTFISSAGAGPKNLHHEKSWRAQGIMESDPPIHTTMRQAMGSVISPRGMRALRNQFQQFADELVDRILDMREFDAAKDFAEVFPLRVFGDAVGIPREGRAENLLALGAMNFSTFGPDDERAKEYFRMGQGTNDWAMANCAREKLAEGSLGQQIWDCADKGEISSDQAALLVRAMLSAGLDTTIFSIGNVMRLLSVHPGEWSKVHVNPRLTKFAIDESFRLESPFQSFYRTTSRDVDFHGMQIPADSKLAVFVGAANRDPRHWGEDADRYDIERQAGGHLGFGMGIHQCVGQPMSRLEMDVLLTTLAARVKAIESAGDAVPYLHNTLRGWESIPIKIVPA